MGFVTWECTTWALSHGNVTLGEGREGYHIGKMDIGSVTLGESHWMMSHWCEGYWESRITGWGIKGTDWEI